MIQRNSMKSIVLLGLATLYLSGCGTMDVINKKAVKIDGELYQLNENKQIELTTDELNRLEAKGKVVRVKHIAMDNALIIEPDELTLLTQDQRLFFSKVSQAEDGDKSVFVKKGSLSNSLNEMAIQLGWNKVSWQLPVDYYVTNTFLVSGGDAQSMFVEALSEYPVYVVFNEQDKTVIVTPAQ